MLPKIFKGLLKHGGCNPVWVQFHAYQKIDISLIDNALNGSFGIQGKEETSLPSFNI